MKAILRLLAFAMLGLQASAAEFVRSDKHESVEAFVGALKSFQPATTKSDLSALFTVPEPGQPEDPGTAQPTTATVIQSAVSLWCDDVQALVFATAQPPIKATQSSVGVLFLLVHQHRHWQIGDLMRFTATGKYAEVSAAVTGSAGTGSGVHNLPIITIKESHGGRGHSYQLSATYTVASSRLQRLELE
jgi:hypothetical protein